MCVLVVMARKYPDTSGDIIIDEDVIAYYRRLNEPIEPYQLRVVPAQHLLQPCFVTNFREHDDAFKPEIGRNLCRVVRIEITASNSFDPFNELFPKEEKNYGGYKKDILTENLNEREKASFICTVCEGIMKDACISDLEEQFCSCCGNSYRTKTPDKSVRKMINSLKCSCPLSERGCKWLGSLKDCENHLDTCGYVYEACELTCGAVLRREELRIHEKRCPKMKVSCDFACGEVLCREDMEQHLKRHCDMVREKCRLGCGVELTRNELRIHVKENCPNRIVKCEHCQKDFKSCELDGHFEKCPKMKVSCNLNCGLVMCREEMEQHLKRHCGMVRETCRLGCGVELTRNELRIHVKENCVQRKIRCEHCSISVRFCDKPKHLKECPRVIVPCELCRVETRREDMTKHLSNDCIEKEIECPFVKYKCMTRIKRKDMDKHLEEKETKHLGLKLTAMEDLITKQSEKIVEQMWFTKQSEKINEQSFQTSMNKVFEKINKQSEKINEQSVEITIHGYRARKSIKAGNQ